MKNLRIIFSNSEISSNIKYDYDLHAIMLSYLCIPLLIFAFGWLKPVYATLFVILVIACSILVLSSTQFERYSFDSKKCRILWISLLLLFIWVFISGIGGYGLQSWDFHSRNALFHDLISHSWPVHYDYSHVPEMAAMFGDSGRLVYYFNFFLPAALFGKIFGWNTANFFLFFWSFTGVLLVTALIYRFFRKASVWILLAFIFFSGMDILASMGTAAGMDKMPLFASILNALWGTQQLEWWAGSVFQYSSFTTQLFNVFNQAIPAWIITLIVLQLKERKSLFFYYSLLLLYAPLPFLGLLPFVLYQFFHMRKNKLPFVDAKESTLRKTIKAIWESNRDWLTFQNLAGGGVIMLISIAFLFQNVGHHPSGFIWQFQPNFAALIFIFFVFCLLEFLLLGLLLNFSNAPRDLLWLSILSLLVIPLFKYGLWNDFAMRVSIPALLVLFLLSISALQRKANAFSILELLIILILLVGAITPFHEIHRSIEQVFIAKGSPETNDSWKSFDYGGYIDKMESAPNFVVSDTESSKLPGWFFKQ